MNKTYLLADIGNTAIDLAIYNDGFRFIKKIYNYDIEAIKNFVYEHYKSVDEVFISSVNKKGLENFLKSLPIDTKINLINPKTMENYSKKEGFTITNTDYLGSDLFLDIIAHDTGNQIIIDLGTVGKILFVDNNKVFHGCSIIPNHTSFSTTISTNTDQIKKTNLIKNPPIISLKTEECISSGSLFGLTGMISYIVKKIEKDFSTEKPTITLTGGYSSDVKDLLIENLDFTFNYDPLLTLKGLVNLIKKG